MESQKQKVIVVVTTEANQEVKDCLRLAASSLQAAADSMSFSNISTASTDPSPLSQDVDVDSSQAKNEDGESSTAPVKRKRGRPKKAPLTPSTSDSLAPSPLSQNDEMDGNQKRKRGRPSKKSEEPSTAPVKRKVGRPKKTPSTSDSQANKESTQEKHDNDSNDVCPVCLEVPSLPVPLQCRHVYCFICAKGLAESDILNGGSCAICRAPIPRDFFKSWKLSQIENETKKDSSDTKIHCWFYEGRQGWW